MKTFIYCFFFFIGLFAQAFETQAQPEIWYEGDNCLEESSWFILHRSGMSVTIMGWRVTGNFSYVYEPQPGTDIIEVMWHEPGTYRVEVDYIPYNQWDFVTLSYDITIVNRTLTSVSLSGPSSIMKGQSATYIATGSLSGGNYSFYVNNNWIQNTTPNSFTTTTLNNGDVVKVVFFPNRPCTSYSETSMQIIVNETSTQAPRVPSVSTNNCGPKTLTATGSPSGNIRWYWQGTNAGGQSTALPATVPYIATSSGTYYIKAVNNPGTWSSATPVNVIVNDPPPPAANNYTFCEWDEMRLTTSGVPLNGTLKWYNTADQLVYTGVSYLVNHKAGSYTYRVRSVGNSDCQSATYATVTVQVNISCDQYLNWQESTQYTIDNGGNPVPAASSKSYADAFGKPLQTQGRSLSTNQVLAAQPVKNQFGELALQSLAAPISSASFGYRHNFMTNEGGTKYGANDFDLRSLPPGGGGVTTGVNLISASTDASNADGFKPSGPVLISAVSQNGQTYVKVVATSYSETPGAWPIGSGSGSYIVTPGASYTLRVKGYRDTPGAVYLYARSAVGTQQNIVWPGASLPLGAQNEGWSQNAIVVPEDVNEITVGVLFSIPSVGSTFYINDIELWDSRTGMVMSPKQVANGGPGTLGWYYSTANTLEPQTPVTKYPYSRSFIPEGPDPKTSSAARPGDQHYMGSGHNVNTRRELIAPGDLSTHLSMRSQFVPGAANAIAGYKYITTNPDGKKSRKAHIC